MFIQNQAARDRQINAHYYGLKFSFQLYCGIWLLTVPITGKEASGEHQRTEKNRCVTGVSRAVEGFMRMVVTLRLMMRTIPARTARIQAPTPNLEQKSFA
jgi:hypothetical protein